MKKYAVIMAGGVGTRFWPVSRVSKPKQFLDILGLGQTLLQMTYARFEAILPSENIYIVTNEGYRDLIKQQLPNIKDDQILGEPMAKNTAPCIAYACYKIAAKDPDSVVVVAPSDHLILDKQSFINQVNGGMDFAINNDALVTLGIKPSRPDTGYGYIQYKEAEASAGVHEVKTFTEKPNLDLAQKFVNSGDFLWNAGIFIWKLDSVLKAFEDHLSEMSDLFKSGKNDYYTDQENAFIEKIYPSCQNISIDYGIIEKSDNVFVLPSDFGWSDLGTWKSLYDVAEKNSEENVQIGKQVEFNSSNNNLVVASDNKLIVLEGVNNLFVLDTEDALLVCNMDNEQEVKRIVNEVKAKFNGDYI
ncbi:MAG: mannose-1-phosphate guanylyltransferase [Bacteroidia bacterium]|nr:mannose-1-phosphate guanylyltransferase [Bacteroidia bacterium]